MYSYPTQLSRASDAKLRDRNEIKAFTSILCIAGELRNKKLSLGEFGNNDRDGIE
jgi:hypothetical protein